jgi:uncharacterized membrane protein YeaQ/YmgE (transglycosylase-associated protein family)
MGIIAWIVLGIIAGVLAEHPVSGRESHGVVVTCLIGVVGAVVLPGAVQSVEGRRGGRRSVRR